MKLQKMKLQTPTSKFQGSSKSQTAKRAVNHSKRKLWLIGAATQSGRGQPHSKTLRLHHQTVEHCRVAPLPSP